MSSLHEKRVLWRKNTFASVCTCIIADRSSTHRFDNLARVKSSCPLDPPRSLTAAGFARHSCCCSAKAHGLQLPAATGSMIVVPDQDADVTCSPLVFNRLQFEAYIWDRWYCNEDCCVRRLKPILYRLVFLRQGRDLSPQNSRSAHQ
eukprot:gnl/TRDRNA2_/TRDRNA2_127389_c1_seq1.p1 gnl/TRDRNA2_/TRDRNA2_127389_c1~~gnl/TRDRNA2_/TRDRNA2_127389_c1_seq1.p1  ORF type:complete len:167 (+),score=17.11 gnl/TRDRNA2_/TRDRNA2_127389_c1_seq1:63-503(+)